MLSNFLNTHGVKELSKQDQSVIEGGNEDEGGIFNLALYNVCHLFATASANQAAADAAWAGGNWDQADIAASYHVHYSECYYG